MSADGEIEVKVNAEGVDEASEELAGEDGVGGGGGGGGREDTGLRGSLRSGLLAGALLAALGPLVEVVGAVLDVLNAFLAPIAALSLRLLAPVLRFMLTKLLPPWLKFVNVAGGALPEMRAALVTLVAPLLVIPLLPSLIAAKLSGYFESLGEDARNIGSDVWDKMKSWASGLATDIGNLAGDIWGKVKQLASDIGQEIGKRVPGVSSGPSDSPSGDGDGGLLRNNPAYDAGREVGTRVNISGGLGAFVENVDKDTGLDLP